MKCYDCGHYDSRVIESRELEDATSIRRRRQCLSCGTRFTTYERLDVRPLMVVKKDGRREPFQLAKLTAGLVRALEKRPVPAETVEKVAAGIERELRNRGEAEVGTHDIGEVVMARLALLDDVAYVRFASIYRSFTDLASFERELKKLRMRSVRPEPYV